MTKVIRIFELLLRETVKGWPFMGSTSEERQNGRGVLLIGSMTDFMVSDRVSRSRSPVCGAHRVSKAEEEMVEVEKSK